ncbi:MAG: FtsW/RodA/SpoVE family cell cycle protein [Kiritimatiellae bacterium]|nr:FtsW/RodA/SpoVE family cell cycle protein [Kiritimatiellia bacterium]
MLSWLKRFDWLMFASMLALIAIGTVSIWSAGNARAEALFHDMWRSNLATAAVGLALYFALALADYRRYLGVLAAPAYAASVAFLVAVLVVGSTVYGGRRWLWFFQPSEVSKICVIALLASLFGSDGGRMAALRPTFRGFLLAAALVGVPAALILAEPDLGTALTLVPAAITMLLVAGVWRRGLVAIVAIGGIAALAVLGAVYEAERPGVPPERRERILRMVPLRPHQVRRVSVFLFPEADVTNAGYNLRQAKISIGSGGFSGKGIGKGETNHLKYLPQAISMNDFIFCVYAEETGFVGSSVLLLLFGLLLLSGCRAAFVSSDGRGRLFAIGFSTLVFAHVYVNIAMSIGLVPITGLPLPLISSGRTFLVTVMCGLGIMQSVSTHRGKTT